MTSHLFRPPERVSVKILESEKRFAVNRVLNVGQNYAEHAIETGFNQIVISRSILQNRVFCGRFGKDNPIPLQYQ